MTSLQQQIDNARAERRRLLDATNVQTKLIKQLRRQQMQELLSAKAGVPVDIGDIVEYSIVLSDSYTAHHTSVVKGFETVAGDLVCVRMGLTGAIYEDQLADVTIHSVTKR